MSATSRIREDTRATAVLRDAVACLRDGRASEADGILARMQVEGAFASNGKFLYPVLDIIECAVAAGDILPAWCVADGLRPFTVKTHDLDEECVGLLSGVFEGLRDNAPVGVLPHWLTEHYVVSLYVPDAVDLRPSPDITSLCDAKAVHDICALQLSRLLEADSRVRAAVTGTGRREFPLLSRYRAGQRIVGRRLGSGAAADLDSRFDPRILPRRRCSLYDFKPANQIVRREDRQRLSGTRPPRTYKADLDMAYWECPVGLELVLIYFSHPIAFEIAGRLDDQLDHQLLRLESMGREFGAGSRAQLLQLTWYHLVRNFASAIELDDTAKALEMGQLLHSAARHVGLSRKSSFIRMIERWREEVVS